MATESNRDLNAIVAMLGSPKWQTVREGVRRAGRLLAMRTLPDSDAATVGDRLLDVARHPRWQVRRDIGHAARYLRHETYHRTVAILMADRDSLVRDAIRRTVVLRRELTRVDTLEEQHADLLQRWLSELEGRHGPRARQDAVRVSGKYAELLMREARHEILKVVGSLDLSLANLENGLGRARLDREACLEHVARARSRLRFLTSIVDSLREFATEVTPEFRGEDLCGMIDEAVGIAKDSRGAKDHGVEVEVNVAAAIRIDAHRYRLLQAFRNIVQNAFDAYDGIDRGQVRSKIVITARAERDHVLVAFTDRGCGMSEEALRDAVQLYSSKKPDGTGFGLPLAKKIVETEHQGSIKLSSKKGAGTTVTVVLPIEQKDRQG